MNILSNINSLALNNPKELIDKAEQNYNTEINSIFNQITANPNYKIVLLAGPSGSGKTTTAHILKTKLDAANIKAEVVSLDHFFLSGDKMPKQENGEPDFESVYSLDVPEIHKCLGELITFGKTTIPIFSFQTKSREEQGHLIDISKGGILIVEGLHALNPVLTDKLNSENLFKIYISVNCSVVDDNGNKLLSSRQMRLIRRMSRDYIYRNTSAVDTLKLWTAVVNGEEKYLYPFKEKADVLLKTYHCYEPCIFKKIILNLLRDLPTTAENYNYIMMAKNSLEKFVALDTELVPNSSLIREFLPGGDFEGAK